MHREDIIARLRPHKDAIRAFGAQSLFLFGSAARGQSHSDSDVDVFVDPDYGSFTLLAWVDLQTFLSEVLGQPVDLTTRNALHPALRDVIEGSATRVL